MPPGAQIDKFVQGNKDILPDDIENLAKTHLLSQEDANIRYAQHYVRMSALRIKVR